jgi:hypothetical protein
MTAPKLPIDQGIAHEPEGNISPVSHWQRAEVRARWRRENPQRFPRRYPGMRGVIRALAVVHNERAARSAYVQQLAPILPTYIRAMAVRLRWIAANQGDCLGPSHAGRRGRAGHADVYSVRDDASRGVVQECCRARVRGSHGPLDNGLNQSP